MTLLQRPRVIAHRTCPLDAAENSLRGIAVAAELGSDAVEVDVRMTRDHELVLFHDRSAWRVARRPLPTRLLTLRTLVAAAGVVTLAEALAAAPPGVSLAIDLKAPGALPAVLEAVERAERPDVMLWCRSRKAISDLRHQAPWLSTALLRNTWTSAGTRRYLRDAARCGADAVSLHQRVVSPEVVSHAHGLGLLAYAWVVEEEDHQRVAACDVDGLVTDWPALARSLVER